MTGPDSGHVPGLHPLSGFFTKDQGLLAVPGRCFAPDAWGRTGGIDAGG